MRGSRVLLNLVINELKIQSIGQAGKQHRPETQDTRYKYTTIGIED